jgi:hypothetical protein
LPIRLAASGIIAQAARPAAEASRSTWRVSAEILSVPSTRSIDGSPAPPMSTSTAGSASRSIIIGTRLWPPAMTRASSPASASADTASSQEPARTYSKGAADIGG